MTYYCLTRRLHDLEVVAEQAARNCEKIAKAVEEAKRTCARLEELEHIVQHTSEPPYIVNTDKLEVRWMKTPDYTGVRLWAWGNEEWIVDCQARGSCEWKHIPYGASPLEVAKEVVKVVNHEMALLRNYEAWRAACAKVCQESRLTFSSLSRFRFLASALERAGVVCPDTVEVRGEQVHVSWTSARVHITVGIGCEAANGAGSVDLTVGRGGVTTYHNTSALVARLDTLVGNLHFPTHDENGTQSS